MFGFVTDSRARALLLLGWLLPLALGACQVNVGHLDIRLVYADSDDPFRPDSEVFERIRIRVEGDTIGERVTEFDKKDRGGTLSDVPVGERVRVLVEGLDGIGTPRYRGVSSTLTTQSGQNLIYLFFSRIGEFSAPPTVSSSITPDWRERFRIGLRPGGGRAYHTASVLADDSVLLTGGSQTIDPVDHLARLLPGQALLSAERFDPTAGAFIKDAAFCTADVDVDRDGYGASPDCLGMDCDDHDDTVHDSCGPGCQDNDGDGYGIGGDCLGSDCDDVDPDCAFGACCGECPRNGEMCMAAARAHHAILPLADDDIWVVLGGEPGGLLVDAEYFRVSQQAFSAQPGILNHPRTRLAAALVGPEMMIIAGGLDRDYAVTDTVEVAGQDVDFDPLGSLRVARAGSAVVAYPNGALVIGGWDRFGGDISERRASKAIDRLTVSGGEVSIFNGDSFVLHEARAEASAVVFIDEKYGKTRVLVCGGLTDATNATRSCEVIQPAEGIVEWLDAGNQDNLDVPRWGHTTTLLPDGNGLIAGGFFPGVSASARNRAVIIDPNSGQLLQQLVMRSKRGGHTATLMPNGMVLLAGGLAGPGEMASPAYEIYNP